MATPSYTLYSPSGSFLAFAPLIVAEYSGVTVRVVKKGIEQYITLKSPTLKAPILETHQGEVIYSCRAIAKFIAGLRQDTCLIGIGSLQQMATIEDWINWTEQEIELPATIAYYMVMRILPFKEEAYKKAKEDMKSALDILELYLQKTNGSNKEDRIYLVNPQHITLADIFLACFLVYPFTLIFDDLKPYTNTVRWFTNCVEQPEFLAVLGKVEYACNNKN
mmetsp:Transcript_64243/g.73975  ORF Transcript_64243/g.73975 Transcript_64243/m.73975 type:complete len:221 (+) Transcript_64243:122-784(+)